MGVGLVFVCVVCFAELGFAVSFVLGVVAVVFWKNLRKSVIDGLLMGFRCERILGRSCSFHFAFRSQFRGEAVFV